MSYICGVGADPYIIVALYLDNRYLSSEDTDLVNLVTADIAHYQKSATPDRVLLFPPVESYYRLLIHRTAEDFPGLCSFSIGAGDERRTIVCQQISVLRAIQMDTWSNDTSESVEKIQRAVSIKQPRWGHEGFTQGQANDVTRSTGRGRGRRTEQPPPRDSMWQHDDRGDNSSQSGGSPYSRTSDTVAVGSEVTDRSSRRHSPVIEKHAARNKGKRPDVQVYVPRGKRVQHEVQLEHSPEVAVGSMNDVLQDQDDTSAEPTGRHPIGRKPKQRPTAETYVPRGRRMLLDKHVVQKELGQSEEEELGQESGISQSESKDVCQSLTEVKDNWEDHWCEAGTVLDEREYMKQSESTNLGQDVSHDPKHQRHRSKKKRDDIEKSPDVVKEGHSGHHKSKRKHHSKDRERRSGDRVGSKDRERRSGDRVGSKDRRENHRSKHKSQDKEHSEHHRKDSSNMAEVENIQDSSPLHNNDQIQLIEGTLIVEKSDIHCVGELAQSHVELSEMVKAESSDCTRACVPLDVSHVVCTGTSDDQDILCNDELNNVNNASEENLSLDFEMESHGSKVVLSNYSDKSLDIEKQQNVDLGECTVDTHNSTPEICTENELEYVPAFSHEATMECSSVVQDGHVNLPNDIESVEQSSFDNSEMTTNLDEDCVDSDIVKVNVMANAASDSVVIGESLIKDHCVMENSFMNNNSEVSTVDKIEITDNLACVIIDQSEGGIEIVDTDEKMCDDLSSDLLDQSQNLQNDQSTGVLCAKDSDINALVENSDVQSEAMTQVTYPGTDESQPMIQISDSEMLEQMPKVSCTETNQSESTIDLLSIQSELTTQVTCSDVNESKTVNLLNEQVTNQSEATVPVTHPDLNHSEAMTKSDVDQSETVTHETDQLETVILTEANQTISTTHVVNSEVNQSEPVTHIVQSEVSQSETALDEDEEDSWDTMYDDAGEALDSNMMEELTAAVGNVQVQKTQFDYYNYQPKDPDLDYEAYSHLLEIHDFPASLITRDLIVAFKEFQANGFDIKWVDDNHAIGVFSSKFSARSALSLQHPLIKVRPLSEATRQTKLKAKKSTEFLQPYRPRPETVASVARNMVAGALGLRSKIPKEKREEERRKIQEAREKKKQSSREKKDAWGGSIGRCAMDDIS